MERNRCEVELPGRIVMEIIDKVNRKKSGIAANLFDFDFDFDFGSEF